MGTHIVRDGNSFYEIDEDCIWAKQEREEQRKQNESRDSDNLRSYCANEGKLPVTCRRSVRKKDGK